MAFIGIEKLCIERPPVIDQGNQATNDPAGTVQPVHPHPVGNTIAYWNPDES